MEFTTEQEKKAFNSLSKEIRDFLLSDEFRETVMTLGKKYTLLLDKVEILERETLWIIYGLRSAKDFVENLGKHLGISNQQASEIARDVNDLVFIKIRHDLQTAQSATPDGAESARTDATREEILAEIENPTPSAHPITIPTPETASTVAHDFIGSKLTQTVTIPSQKATVSLQSPVTPAAPVKPVTYAADPYRESIN